MTSSRDTQTLSVAELKVAYAEVRSDKETKPVTISAARLPANAAGYDLIVVETDMSGNHKVMRCPLHTSALIAL